MVCCAILSILLAGMAWLVRSAIPSANRIERSPLSWRLASPEPVAGKKLQCCGSFAMSARLRSISFAIDGLGRMLRNEHNAWIHLTATIVIVAVSVVLEIRYADWRWIIISVLWVWFAEAINTAFEHLCDFISPEKNESIRSAKDIAAGAVLLSSMAAVLIGALTLFPYIASEMRIDPADLILCRATK